MAARRSATDIPPDQTVLITVIGTIAAVVMTVFGLPGMLGLAIALTVAGFRAQYPQLTGGKTTAPRPNSDFERLEVTKYHRRRDWRYRVLIPNPDWGTLWPIRSSIVAAFAIAAITFCLPVAGGSMLLAGINAYAAYGITAQYTASRRRNRLPEETVDAMSLDKTLLGALSTVGARSLWTKVAPRAATALSLACAALIGGVAAFAGWLSAATLTEMVRPLGDQLSALREGFGRIIDGIIGFFGEIIVGEDFAPDFSAETMLSVAEPATELTLLLAASALLAASLPFVPLWRSRTLAPALTRHEARTEWRPGWETLKYDPIPRILSRKSVGQLTVDTFATPPGIGVGEFLDKEPKISPAVPGGRSIAIADERNVDGQGQPVPGTQHPAQFRAVQWPVEDRPQLNDPSLDFAVVEEYMNAIAGPAARKAAVAVPVHFDQITPLHSEESSVAAYKVTCSTLPPNLYAFMRDAAAGEFFGTMFAMELVINHRPNKDGGCAFYFGSVTDPGFVPNETALEAVPGAKNGKTTLDIIGELAAEDYWKGLWSGTDVLAVGKLPIIYHEVKHTDHLADGTEIIRQAFTLREGQSYEDLFKVEPRFRATAMRTPFASVTGFPVKRDREGERRDGAIYLSYCPPVSSEGKPQTNARIPAGPANLAPPEPGRGQRYLAQTWVLAGRINEAFDAVRMARPEVVSARPLTNPRSRSGHIWEVRMRLYGSVTYDEVRAKSKKLRELLGDIPWLRVGYDKQLAQLYIGANPEDVELADERRDRARIVELDWANSFEVAKVVGSDGSLPQLVSTAVMPENADVRKIVFTMPSGVSLEKVKGSVSKLTGASGMGFISAASGSNPTEFELTVSRRDPMPERVGYDFDRPVVDECLNFAVRVDGSSVFYDPSDSPHIMFMGTSGSGKSATGQNFAYGAIAAGWDVMFVDAQKEAADFKFAEHRALTVATTIEDACAAMELAYSIVRDRVRLNSTHGTTNITELPGEVRPRRLFVFVDEFNNLIDAGSRPPSRPESDPDLERSRLAAIAEYENRSRIADLTKRIAAEARSAGVHVVVMGQKFPAKLMEKANTLKTNAARLLQGKTNYGDRASALRAPDAAPDLGEEVPKGRAVWESVSLPVEMIQTRFATPDEYARELRAISADLHPVEQIDLEPFRPRTKEIYVEGEEIDSSQAVYDGEAEFSLGSIADEEETDVEVSDDGALDLSALFGSDEPDEEEPALSFSDDEPEAEEPALDFGDATPEEPDEGPLPFEVEEEEEEEAPLDFGSADDEPLTISDEGEPEVIEAEPVDEPVDEDMSGDLILIDARALSVVQALPGATTSVPVGRGKVHIFTEALDQLSATGARILVLPGDDVEHLVAEAYDIEIADVGLDSVEDLPIAPGTSLSIIGADIDRKETAELRELFEDCRTLVVSASGRAGVSIMQINKVIGHHAGEGERHSAPKKRVVATRASVGSRTIRRATPERTR